jgi:hypothetical protein
MVHVRAQLLVVVTLGVGSVGLVVLPVLIRWLRRRRKRKPAKAATSDTCGSQVSSWCGRQCIVV